MSIKDIQNNILSFPEEIRAKTQLEDQNYRLSTGILERHLNTSVQFTSVSQSRPTPCDTMDYNTPGFPAHRQHPEPAQTHDN